MLLVTEAICGESTLDTERKYELKGLEEITAKEANETHQHQREDKPLPVPQVEIIEVIDLEDLESEPED